MDRHSRGLPLTIQTKQPIFNNGEFPNVEGLDLTEIQALKRQANAEVTRLQKLMQEQERNKRTAEQNKLHDQIKQLQKQIEESGLAARGKVEPDRANNTIS